MTSDQVIDGENIDPQIRDKIELKSDLTFHRSFVCLNCVQLLSRTNPLEARTSEHIEEARKKGRGGNEQDLEEKE